MEVWWVGPDGSVQAAYHEAGWQTFPPQVESHFRRSGDKNRLWTEAVRRPGP